MMHRSKKLLGSDQGYFNEKRPVNVRVDGTAHLAESLPTPGGRRVLLFLTKPANIEKRSPVRLAGVGIGTSARLASCLSWRRLRG